MQQISYTDPLGSWIEEIRLQSEQCSAQNDPFLPDVMTKDMHIINKIHHFSKLCSIYRHNNNINGSHMYVLVGIEVLHMNVAEKVFKFQLPSNLAANLAAILNFPKCSRISACYTADM